MRPLILLLAPAGFGKSTLAAAYSRESGAVVAWFTLRPGDSDCRIFFSGVRDALEAAFGDMNLVANVRRGLTEGATGIGLARLSWRTSRSRPPGSSWCWTTTTLCRTLTKSTRRSTCWYAACRK
jgi:hypothetical protein